MLFLTDSTSFYILESFKQHENPQIHFRNAHKIYKHSKFTTDNVWIRHADTTQHQAHAWRILMACSLKDCGLQMLKATMAVWNTKTKRIERKYTVQKSDVDVV